VGRENVDGSVTTKEAFARPKYVGIIAGSRQEDRGETEKRENYDDGRDKSASVIVILVIDIPW
jgi:hypothetical protein